MEKLKRYIPFKLCIIHILIIFNIIEVICGQRSEIMDHLSIPIKDVALSPRLSDNIR